MVKATLEAVQKFDPAIEKDPLVLTLNAIEELVKKRGQEAAKAAQAKASEAERAAAKENKDAKPAEAPAAEAKAEAPKPMTPAELLADVEGVSAEDMRKFRAAAYKAQRDPKVKEIKAKRVQLSKEAEFLSQEEKKNMRGEFEQLQSDLRKANLDAIAQAAPDLSKETLEKIYDAVEARTREGSEKAGKEKAAVGERQGAERDWGRRHTRVTGLGCRCRYGSRFGNQIRDLYLNLNTRTRYPTAET